MSREAVLSPATIRVVTDPGSTQPSVPNPPPQVLNPCTATGEKKPYVAFTRHLNT